MKVRNGELYLTVEEFEIARNEIVGTSFTVEGLNYMLGNSNYDYILKNEFKADKATLRMAAYNGLISTYVGKRPIPVGAAPTLLNKIQDIVKEYNMKKDIEFSEKYNMSLFSKEKAEELVEDFKTKKKFTILKPKEKCRHLAWVKEMDEVHGERFATSDFVPRTRHLGGEEYTVELWSESGYRYLLDWTDLYKDISVETHSRAEVVAEMKLKNGKIFVSKSYMSRVREMFDDHQVNFTIHKPKNTDEAYCWVEGMDDFDGKTLNVKDVLLRHHSDTGEIYFNYKGYNFSPAWTNLFDSDFRSERYYTFSEKIKKELDEIRESKKELLTAKTTSVSDIDTEVEEDNSWGGVIAALAIAGGLAAVKSKKQKAEEKSYAHR